MTAKETRRFKPVLEAIRKEGIQAYIKIASTKTQTEKQATEETKAATTATTKQTEAVWGLGIGEEIGREVVKRVKDGMRLKDVVRKRPERVIWEVVGISDWFRRVRDCVIGWNQVGIGKRMSDGIARRRYEDVESVDENRKGEVGR